MFQGTSSVSNNIAIKVDGVSKSFRLPHEKHGSIKSLLLSGFEGKKSFEKQEVLKDISFEIKKGEFFGIVGRNGSGKSTLLKLLAGIYSPDSGHIQINGKLTPFIELGVGFNPELTGRENVFLNGALLGFDRKEMNEMYDEIVEFAELEKFMDQKLKNYSSGMQVRLAFSIAIRAKTDILLIDEVLAVGDTAFQRKCFDMFESFKAEKRTVVLVTHDMGAVREFCNRAMLIAEGKLVKIDEPRVVAGAYDELNQQNIDKNTEDQNKTIKKSKIQVQIKNIEGLPKASFLRGEKVKLSFNWGEGIAIENIGVAIFKESGEMIFGTNTIELSKANKLRIKDNKVELVLTLNIGKGKYHLTYGGFGKSRHDIKEFIVNGPTFNVIDSKRNDWEGIIYLENHWTGEEIEKHK